MNVHLNPRHLSLQIFEAPSVETVRDLLFRAGFLAFLDATIYPLSQIDEMMKKIDEFPTVY